MRRIFAAEPVLVDVRRAGELIPALDAARLILHAGPPIEWARMCGPLRGAVCGAIVFEGWAGDLDAAEKLAASGGVSFAPNHHHGAVGPMTGITTRSMPLLVVENRKFGNWAACTINEGLGNGADQLLLKAALDGFASIAFAASFGWGVAASVLALVAVQGGLTALGAGLGSFVPDAHLSALTATGGLLIVGVALRLLDLKEVKVADLLPALLIAPLRVQLVVVLR